MKFKHWAVASMMLATSLQTFSAMGSDADFACISQVQSFSNLVRMKKGDFTANVKWKDVALFNTSIGYGAAENHRYELTIMDGKVYMARPGKGGAVTIRHDPKPGEGAAMLQVASPKAWGQQGTLPEINSFDELNFELDQVVDDLECGDDVLLPFKIKGYAKSVTWSMDTHPSRVITTKDQSVVIVGLYNRSDKTKYFMVKGYNIHPHVVMPGVGYAGHLRSVELNEGAALLLPENAAVPLRVK